MWGSWDIRLIVNGYAAQRLAQHSYTRWLVEV